MSKHSVDKGLVCIVLNANYLRQWSGELTDAQTEKIEMACDLLAEVFEEIHDK